MSAFTLDWIKCRRFLQITSPAYFPAEWTHTDGVGVYTEKHLSIGEFVIFRGKMHTDTDIRGTVIYFCPSTFVPINTTNKGYYKFVIPPTAIVGDLVQAVWVGTSPTQDNRDLNLEIESVGATSGFTFQHTLVVGADNKGYYQNAPLINHDKLLKNSVDNPVELTNTDYNDFYHNTAAGEYRFEIYNTSNTGTMIIAPTIFPIGQIRLYGSWYNKYNDNAAPYILQDSWVLTGDTSGDTLTCLSKFEDTKVTLTCDFLGLTPKGLCVYLIETNSTDNTVTFWNNYGTAGGRWTLITTVGGTASLNSQLRHPTNLWVNTSGTLYESDFIVRASGLDATKCYRIIACAYGDVDEKMQSFISPQYCICSKPPSTPIIADSNSIQNYHGLAATTFKQPVIKERMLHDVVIGAAAFSNFLSDLAGNLGSATLVSVIPRRITHVVFDDSGFFNILDQKIFNFQSWQWNGTDYDAYFGATGDEALDGDAFKINTTFKSVDGITCSDWATGLRRVVRVRYESDIQNPSSFTLLGAPTTPQTTQDWNGRDVYSCFIVNLEVKYTSDGVSYTYTEQMMWNTLMQKIANTGDFQVELFKADGTTPLQEAGICGEETIKVKVTLLGIAGSDYKVIAVLDYTTQSINHVEENEEAAAVNMVQMDSTAISGDGVTVADIAWLTIDCTQLVAGRDYYLSIILNKVV